MSAPFVALDLGSSRALALAARPTEDGIEVLGIAQEPCRGLRRGIVSDLEEAGRAGEAALAALSAKLGEPIAEVTVAVGGTHVEGTNGQGEKNVVPRGRTITHADVAEVVDRSRAIVFPPDRELFQALPREFRIDGQRNILRPVGMCGARLEVVTYLVSGQSAHLQNLGRAASRSGRRVGAMVLSPLAAGVAVLTQEEIESGAAVVDVGAGKTDLAIFVGGSLVYSASVPIGSALVSSDLSKLLKTSPEEGERLKIEHACALADRIGGDETVEVRQLGAPEPRPMQLRVLAEIVESRMRELATIVAQHVERSGYSAVLPGGIALTGGGSQLRGTEALFRDVLRHARVRLAFPAMGGDPRPETAVAVGLAQFALGAREEAVPEPSFFLRARGLLGLLRPGARGRASSL